ncbi:MAG TPA: lipase maturation factor family protein [Terriglobales bacterium]|nr:lipase maturation factor family protein [Terriglobales bacterium]
MPGKSLPLIGWLFDSRQGAADRLVPRWLFLRALGLIYFSAFLSVLFQVRGLIGPAGILPAGSYLQQVAQSLVHLERLWYAPTLLWFSSSSAMLMAVCWAGLVSSLLVVLNLWPRLTLFVCFICFLSFISAAQDFSSYQSDGMLLEAGFISLFFAPPGIRPKLGASHPPSRASLFLLQWEWFRIYFESGAVKLLSGDPEWRNFTAMDQYYQNGPLPTWIGWYVQHLPHGVHATAVALTLIMELGLIWMLFLPRRWRIVLFFIVTPWQAMVILTANYAFLNYIVLAMGVLLLDDKFILKVLPEKWRVHIAPRLLTPEQPTGAATENLRAKVGKHWSAIKLAASAVMLTWIFYVTAAELIWMFARNFPLPTSPVAALEPFRIANQYGLFAVMTRGRYEIEFQGSSDGANWTTYPFRYKPQALNESPGIYAPYQPRFDWNLWFASLGQWREYPIVPNTEVRLLANDKDVLALFGGNPFPQQPPKQVRAVLWQYWFTSMAEKRTTGAWWRRQFLGLYAPTLEREADGSIQVIAWPNVPPRE